MSRQEGEPGSRARARANTTSFGSFNPWSRARREPVSSPDPPTPNPPPLTVEELIHALSPPSVPSLAHARALASSLPNCSPLPRRELLTPILDSLCNEVKFPPSVQAAGYEILSSYLENHEVLALSMAERLSYFSLFLGCSSSWSMELWEPKFKALRALTKYGTDIIGIENQTINLLQQWIKGAFEGLLKPPPSIDRPEISERERSMDILVRFLSDILSKPENISRIPDDKLVQVLDFYASLVDHCVSSVDKEKELTAFSPTTSSINAAHQHSKSHRRNASSLSSSSVPPVAFHPSRSFTTYKHAAEFATGLYLNHLSFHIKTLPPTHLNVILPLLFRSLAFCGTPLPRLSVISQSRKKNTVEERITETLNGIFSGPYAATCMLILRRHIFPPSEEKVNIRQSDTLIEQFSTLRLELMTALGAHRTFRNYVRRALSARLARAYIERETSIGYSHSGAPGHMELQDDLMEKAWPKDEYTSTSIGTHGNGWDAARMGKILARSVTKWIAYHSDNSFPVSDVDRRTLWEKVRDGKEDILEEAASVVNDILRELDLRDEDSSLMDEEEANAVGLILLKLTDYILPMKNADGTPLIIPIGTPKEAPTQILQILASLLARDHSRPHNFFLSNIMIHLAEHLTDANTAELPYHMMERYDLSPTSSDWLANWERLLRNDTLFGSDRPQTKKAIMEVLQLVYDSVRDMTVYRRPLGDLVWKFCVSELAPTGKQVDDVDVIWKIIGEEIVLRSTEQDDHDQEGTSITKFLELLFSVASEQPDEEDHKLETPSIGTAELQSPSSTQATASPSLSRTHTDMPSVMSILSSLASGSTPSRSQSMQPNQEDGTKEEYLSSKETGTSDSRSVSTVSTLVEMFSQLTFTPFSLQQKNLLLALRVYQMLLDVVRKAKSVRARLTALQFLVRIRADRDHRLYFANHGYDPNNLVLSLGGLISRVNLELKSSPEQQSDDVTPESTENRKERPRFPERDGRQVSRGRGGTVPSRSEPSRSRSRTAAPLPTVATKHIETLWRIPESLPFNVSEPDSPSEVLVSYDPEGPDRILVLPVSQYLLVIQDILEKETNWEILSYILCHLPVQLSNKHLFCGPRSRVAISKMLSILCAGILNGELGSHIEQWPQGLKARDAHGLAYQTLSVLISYRRCFDLQQRHLLVEVFHAGLNGQLATIKCCLHALSLSAFELQPSVTKCLSRILEKLSQIMSNPNMAVHILGFLSTIGSLPSLHVNFTEGDYKMVFGVALQYLQHHNRLHTSPTLTISWALSQHVRVLSYFTVYIWFLAVKLPDRPRHIRYITRQLLIANEGNTEVDNSTEVCFDWLSRYTYASADSRPANSVFSDIILNPHRETSDITDNQKTWVVGNSIVTIRVIPRSGWAEVISRRPSGLSRFVCRLENVPMVGPGDVDPDLLSIPAGLIMDRDSPRSVVVNNNQQKVDNNSMIHDQFVSNNGDQGDDDLPQPDSITGYVWSKTAPSQRRKQVSIDPSHFILQLSPFPDGKTAPFVKRVKDMTALPRFVASLDRMPVIDTHKVGIMYVAPGQSDEVEILSNAHGSPAYTRFLEGIGRLINLRGQVDVYAGGLDPDEDGEYAYAWWDDIGQILYHTATMMPTTLQDPQCNNKKRHIGNDYVRIIWNDSAKPYIFDTLKTQFQFVNIVIEPHSVGSIAAFSNNIHEIEYFKVTLQLAPGMAEFAPIGHFKLISAENLPLLVRQLSLLSDWFASVFAETQRDTVRVETKTNWQSRLEAIQRFKNQLPQDDAQTDAMDGVMGQEGLRDFTTSF